MAEVTPFADTAISLSECTRERAQQDLAVGRLSAETKA
jgi:hypothetical protein